MAQGNYPIMSRCDAIGINGDCGPSCPVALAGECQHLDEGREKYPEMEFEPYTDKPLP
jgi:hypothetical protein